MYFCLAKIDFDGDPWIDQDIKKLKSLTEKLKQRFKVQAKINVNNGQQFMAITDLNEFSHKLKQKIDDIIDFCETHDFGRVNADFVWVDDLEAAFQLLEKH